MKLAHDWYDGAIPDNIAVDPTAYLGTSYSFRRYRSQQPIGLSVGRAASLCDSTVLDIGPHGRVSLGAYAMISGAWISCDAEIIIDDYALIAWDVVLMDHYSLLRSTNHSRAVPAARPIHIGRNSWIGFGACVLPGIRIGEHAIIGARSVVTEDIPPYAVAPGNPARVVRMLPRA